MGSLGSAIDSRYEDVVAVDAAGTTEVFRARHRVLGAAHILRVLRTGTVAGTGARPAFVEAARLQARLRHPAWVRVHNVYEDADFVAVASEPVNGVVLAERLKSGIPASQADVSAFTLTLAEALEELHGLGGVHHELHPGLIILEGPNSQPRITQFSVTMQQTGEGTAVAYASPEELVHPGSGDPRADVHALAAIAFHWLNGSSPFQGGRRSEVLNRRLVGSGPLAASGHPALNAIIRAAMADRVVDRTESARAFATVLHRWREHHEGGRTEATIELDDPEEASVISAELARQAVDAAADSSGIAADSGASGSATVTEARTETTVTQASRLAAKSLGALVGIGLLVAVVGGLAGFAVYAGWQQWRAERCATLTEQAVGTLARYKTDPVANDDPAVLASALGQATEALQYGDEPRTVGVQALAMAWSDGWHLANAKWDEDRFRRADGVTAQAAEKGSPEGVFARALVTASGCKLLDVSDARRDRLCAEAGERYSAASSALANDPRAWLRFEVMWSQAAYYNLSALAAGAAGDSAGASRAWASSVAICDSGAQLLASSPVNDRELEQECVNATGAVGRYADFFSWAALLQADDRGEDGKLSSWNVEAIYRGASAACRTMKFERNRKGKTVPKAGAIPAYLFCYAAGLRALGCGGQADVVISASYATDPILPWAGISAGGASVPCYLEVP